MSGPPRASADERRLLILEDDELIGLLVSTVAQLEGIAAWRYAEPEAFFAALDTATAMPTHILMDMTLPGSSGEDVLRQLAARGIRARIVIASGVDDERLTAAAELACAIGLELAGVLRKPFLPTALRALLAAG